MRWPRYRNGSGRRLDLDVQPAVLTGFRRHECEFWWGVYDSQFTGSSGAIVNELCGPLAGDVGSRSSCSTVTV